MKMRLGSNFKRVLAVVFCIAVFFLCYHGIYGNFIYNEKTAATDLTSNTVVPSSTPLATPTCRVLVIDDSENNSEWYSFNGSGASVTKEIVDNGSNKSLKITFTNSSGSYWGVNKNISSDWKQWASISFKLKSISKSKLKFKVVELGKDGSSEGESWVYSFDTKDSWETIEIPFSFFIKDPYYQPVGQDNNNTLDLGKIRSINIENGDFSVGSFELDDLTLKSITTVTPVPTPTPVSTPTPVPTATPIPTATPVPSPTIDPNTLMSISGYVSLNVNSEIKELNSGITVKLENTGYSSTTDSNGYFIMNNVPKSIINYNLCFSKHGILERKINIPAYKDQVIGTADEPILLWAGDMPEDGKTDGVINMVDVVQIAKVLNATAGSDKYKSYMDINLDKAINIEDIMILAKRFNRNTGDYEEYKNDVNVFAFSQGPTYAKDPQVLSLKPDMVIRGWQKWKTTGTVPTDYNFKYVNECHKNGTLFIGGATASVLYKDEASSNEQFLDWATRDSENKLVLHDDTFYRASMANPSYRQYLINIGKMQIDGGVDGLFFDEADGAYRGPGWDLNEGYDDYFCKDFNKYLMEKYPDYTKEDWINKFGMAEDNVIKKDVPYDDLNNNFNYRKYLAANKWTQSPFNSLNPLANEWGKQTQNRPQIGDENFTAKYMMLYWHEIVDTLKTYAKTKYNKDIYITSNGIYPYVDFQSIGLYTGNDDDNGKEVNYVPTLAGELNGRASLIPYYLDLKQKSEKVAGDVPVVLFLDWPCKMMDSYYALSSEDKIDFWRIYGAESYACGTPMSFHLKTTISTEPTALTSGILNFLTDYSGFYKKNASLYTGFKPIKTNAEISLPGISSVVTENKKEEQTCIHLINHNYVDIMLPQNNFEVVIPFEQEPEKVEMFSPDLSQSSIPYYTYSNGQLKIKVDSLEYYNIIKIQ